MQLMKKKQNKTNEGTSHHMMFWTPEYCTCYKAPLLNKKIYIKKKGQKKQRRSRRLIWVQAKIAGCMYILLFVSVKTQKPNFCPSVIAASLINNLLEAPSVQSHITSSSLSVGSQVL